MDATNKEEKLPNPRSEANIFEIITFSWIFGIVKKGLKQDLNLIDLYGILNEDSSELLGNKLQKIWNNELINSENKNQKPNLLNTLFKMFGSTFIFLVISITIVEIILSISIATIVGKIVVHFETNSSNISTGIYLLIGLVIILLIRIIIYSGYDMTISHLGMKMRIATCNLIYKKALRLKVNSLDQTSTGQILNLISNDVNRFDTTLVLIPFLLLGPIETVVVTYFLWQEVGVSSILGVATMIMFIPLQLWLGSKTSEIRLKTNKRTDERVHLINEIISGLQVIKMYTWEPFFDNLTKYSRQKEINEIKKTSCIKGILSSFCLFNTKLALFVTLFTYILIGNYITPSKVFIITSYYDSIQRAFVITFPPAIGLSAELLVSIKRIEDFLLNEEKDRQLNNFIKPTTAKNITIGESKVSNKIIDDESGTEQCFGVEFFNVSAKWAVSQPNNTLENVNLFTKPNRLIAIIGPVGAGKSSLLQAILQELPLMKGSISVRGVVSYASQEPWLFTSSVKQNILFGSPMDKSRYDKVIEVCALNPDLEQFPYGDRTIVGEKGISLSGGQKSRINLARAIYKQADIYLLDDPLSAVDTRVGKHLFEKCITDYLKEKTCILITHQIQYLVNVDHIVIIDNAKVLAEGSYRELQKSSSYFKKNQRFSSETSIFNNVIEKNNTDILEKYSINEDSQNPIFIPVTSFVKEIKIINNKDNTDPVKTEETHSIENNSLSVFLKYIFSSEYYFRVFCLFSLCILTQVLLSGTDYWITYWIYLEKKVFQTMEYRTESSTSISTSATILSNGFLTSWTASRQSCIFVFAGLIFLIIIIALIKSFLFVSVCTEASMNLHLRMFSSITRATMSFLNKTPSGRILNRFSKDMGLIDEMIPNTLDKVTQVGLTAIGVIILIGIVNPYLALPTIVLVILFFKMKTIFMKTSQNVKRLEDVTRSPMYTHVNSSLQGIATIRAFNLEQTLIQEFTIHQDLHSSTCYLFLSLNRAFGFWLNISCMFYIIIVIFSLLLISDATNDGRYVGLTVTQAIVITGIFQWVMRFTADLENQMTSVERVLEFSAVPQESTFETTPNKLLLTDWPDNGQIIFEKLYLRYDLESSFVLKNLNIKIKAAEKIGIVGRTGAGKSSLISALFRLAFNEGKIIIDGIEIHELGLHDLRSKISIIPQEPVLFSGTIRSNLDPFNEYPDHILWKALDEVELKKVVDDLSDGLNSKISEGGSNFSVGQRQLVCLARAIIRNNKILVLDEATANVDAQTDSLIQNTIRNKFRKCTVLTIAHRLNTVMDSDKILVMNAGTVVEFDHPYNLLKNKDGYLHKMVEQAGKSNAQSLHNLAYESYNKGLMLNGQRLSSVNEDED
ncbi:LOW QUALITY PROTEIN: probable multidrug resistance-associated protein lethal(2)03659 [Rhopalosiphum padi]|uniref:LOW QUALITY PROTEIN: probable multidrug resistance-associated protein lethal(2)03659 n=1 Tax=Rhopalosiphum padi TaxID=40932 RepID=UPI00298E16F8|nr:LOW QUALITY PROTEIN: probable multidrug resistance-associated protein lethal(2)03659 [Rhopalosiphum padi]